MLDIDTLDTVIALVVVILLLSLIVQAVQSFVKKLLRLKSKEIEASLLDLFSAVLRDRTKPLSGDAKPERPTKRLPGAFAPSRIDVASAEGKDLLAAVKRELQELGRVNARGHFTVESLSKSDLLNVIARVAPGKFGVKLDGALTAFKNLENAVNEVRKQGLPDDVAALWAKFEGAGAPLKQHYSALTAGTGNVAPGVIVADVLQLRSVVFNDSLDLLEKVQESPSVQKLPAVAKAVAAVSGQITAAREALDASFGAFQARLSETEQWFDTTMQSFEERYHRGMRTYTIVIGALVVMLLNANVFTLYRNIAGNEILRGNLMKAGPEIAKMQEDIATREAALDANAQSTPVTRKQLEEQKEELDDLVRMYTDFGLEPVSWKGTTAWFKGLYYDFPGPAWWSRRAGDLHTLFGWFVMTLLLSLGAPFWHDTLESLFGVKNLLRRRNEQQNVEQAPGAGNPKV